MSNNWVNLGTIKKSKQGKQYISVGDNRTSVKLVFMDKATGQVLRESVDPILTITNPRKRANLSEADLAKIPEFVLANVSLAPSKE